MKKKIFFLFIFYFIINLIFINNFTFNLYASSDGPYVFAKAAILYDVSANKTLFKKNEYEKLFPASTTKVMTAILTMENCKLTDLAKVSYYSINFVPKTYSTGLLVPNEELSIEQLLNLLLIPSANDAAYVLAQYIANGCSNHYDMSDSESAKDKFNSDIQKFSSMMNSKAFELGCQNTNFVNPNGIHDENHFSTAYDLCLIGKYALKFNELNNIVKKTFYNLPSTNEYSHFSNKSRTFDNTNLLINKNSPDYYKYATGFKTGYTDPANYCIIASASKDNRTLIAVVLGSESIKNVNSSRENDCIRLFDFGFNNFHYQTIVNKGSLVSNIDIINGTPDSKKLKLIAKDDLSILVKQNYIIDVDRHVVMKKIFAPMKKGDVVGYLECSVDDVNYYVDLVADSDVTASVLSNIVLVSIGSIVLILISYFIFKKKNRLS